MNRQAELEDKKTERKDSKSDIEMKYEEFFFLLLNIFDRV